MEKPEIKLELAGHGYIADVKYGELRRQDYPLQVIAFSDMEDKGTHYELLLDKSSGMPATLMSWDSDLVTVQVPQMVVLDPEGVAEKHRISIDQLPSRDAALTNNEQDMQERIAGNLPKVQIEQQTYFADIRLMELRATDDPSKVINLNELDQTDSGKFVGLYDTKTQQLVDWDMHTTTHLPEGTRMLVIPSELALDPLSALRKYGSAPEELLPKFPLQMMHRADLYPLSVTGIPKQLKQNWLRLSSTREKLKPKIKRSRGRRL